jgi:hypothetical protein
MGEFFNRLGYSPKFALGMGLLLDHRLGWLSGGYGLRVSVHHLPLTLFGSKDHRGAHGVSSGSFALALLDHHLALHALLFVAVDRAVHLVGA